MQKTKSAKRRNCPSLSREITAAECGASRVSRIPCPDSCPFNPFVPSNHTHLEGLFLENLIRITTDLHAEDRRFPVMPGDPADDEWAQFFHDGLKTYHALLVERDAGGATALDRWLATHPAELRNDDRVVVEGLRRARFALMELPGTCPTMEMEVTDLLSDPPQRFSLVSDGLHKMWTPFVIGIAWIVPIQNRWFTLAFSLNLPRAFQLSPPEMAATIAAEVGGPTDPVALASWLPDNAQAFCRVAASTLDFNQRRRTPGLQKLTDEYRDNRRSLIASTVASQRAWLDQPSALLDLQSPRQAATDPALRPRLVQLTKALLNHNGIQQRKAPGTANAAWLAGELGLNELGIPHVPAPTETPADGTSTEPGARSSEPAPFPLAPRLTGPPLSEIEVINRISSVEDIGTKQEDLDNLLHAGFNLVQTREVLAHFELIPIWSAETVLRCYVAWRCLVPHGYASPWIEIESWIDLAESLEIELVDRLYHGPIADQFSPASIEIWIAKRRQPMLTRHLVGYILQTWRYWANEGVDRNVGITMLFRCISVVTGYTEMLDIALRSAAKDPFSAHPNP